MTPTQTNRQLSLTTPLGKDVLLLAAFSGREEMSRPFQYRLDLLSTRQDVAAKDLVGKNVTFTVAREQGTPRCFNGFVSRFSAGGVLFQGLRQYYAEVVPWLWFLSRTADCRVFQNKAVPEVVEQVFKDLGFTDYDWQLKGSHPKWEYCVQYRETDFDFVSRLLEQEGIFYFFRHESGKHTLVLADQKSAYKDCPEKEVDYSTGSLAVPHVTQWEHHYEFRAGKWAHTDYNFEAPATALLVATTSLVKLPPNDKYEIYDYPGQYEKKEQGEADVKVRMEEEEQACDVVVGQSNCGSFAPGGKFKLKSHACPSEAGKGYVLVAVEHSASEGSYVTGNGTGHAYANSFTCIPDGVQFRPARTTRRPVVPGPQPAVVVGPKGEEIYTDKYGRVRVQFFWDREGKRDENSTCWVRVAQPVAGKRWGTSFWPRVGQEVIVTFLEGDPDRPLVTGCVYNAEQMPPYLGDGPDDKHKNDNKVSGFKSNTTKGGQGFNELRFDDTKDRQQVFLHAERNLDVRVKNDSLETVLGERHVLVTKDRNEKVSKNQSLTVGENQNEKVGKNHALGAGQAVHIKAGQAVVIEAAEGLTLKVGGNFVVIDATGVAIKGAQVQINTGGAPGSGGGSHPAEPKEADDARRGSKSAPG
jgi:type VI secretion system secreted protein VgrG